VAKILLRFSHGLGDVVQFVVVLKHLKKHRPDWQIDVRCGRGKHSALRGFCNAVWHDQEPEPPHKLYDTVADIGWYENYLHFGDRPNSKITNCLQEVFGLGWDRELARYEIKLSGDCRGKVANYLRSIGCREVAAEKYNAFVIHYEGNTSTWKKNLSHWQAKVLIDHALAAGRVPVLLDWDGRSPLADNKRVFRPPVGKGDIWGEFGSGDAETIAALIHMAEAFVGIDSGPGKCASATGTPSLSIWRDHSPVQFHDPCPTTMHLVPADWRSVPPCEDNQVASFFEAHYRFRVYRGDGGMVDAAREWLSEVLRFERPKGAGVAYAVPNGIGDILWVLHKIKAVAAGGAIDLVLCGDMRREIDRRAIPFVKRFPFVRSATVLDVPVLDAGYEEDEKKNDEKGRWRYLSDGEHNGFHYLVPNKVLEDGRRLEEWLPEHPIDWSVVDDFDWSGTERGDEVGRALSPFVAFYLGPESGNVDEGHNRGFLWEPKDWVTLAKSVSARDLKIVLVGAPYDMSYWDHYVKRGMEEAGVSCYNLIGKFEIGETMALLRRSQFFVSYQCGLGIFAHYLGKRVAMWWRPDGNSIHPKRLVAFDERMASAWTNPAFTSKGNYLPLLYLREKPDEVIALMEARGWFG
jgi:ADP-heptose:LPS heptosyltransferase